MPKKQKNQYSEEEAALINDFLIANGIYDAVMAQLKLPADDELYQSLVFGMLKRQTKDFLVFTIWDNLNDKQARHLRDFVNQSSVTVPWMAHEGILMEFAMMYPDLMEKIYSGLSEFFKNFIKKFNEISTG